MAAYKPAALVADVLDVADACGFERFDLVGHDFGGMVAWMVAGHHPDRVRTLTVASTPHPAAFKASYQASSDQNERSGYMRSFRAAERGEMEAQLLADDAAGLRLVYGGLDPAAVEEYVAVLAAARRPDGRHRLVPVDVRHGERRDATRLHADALRVERSGPVRSAVRPPRPPPRSSPATYRFEVLEGVGHWIPELAADRFTPLLLAHLAAH